ncbi:MATE family efflux transporter [Coxiella burnetii]|uniref:MATE family efflux transporter n=1 Tax=Coxiella burnetii TaxID=777 RepID=UPI000CCC3708|nr:MATE family efflux transporter [Coxiella burnetii]PNT90168.1 MATE family efflux transporter [Coxiella burnetii]
MNTSTPQIIKNVVNLALPMAESRLIQMLSGFIGMLMLARLGHSILAASMLMTSTQVTIIVIFISLLFSMSVVVGQAYGAKKYDEVGVILQQGCILALILSIPLIILFLVADRILLALGQLPELVIYVKHYFRALIWGTPGFILLAALQQALYGMSRQRIVILANLFCLGVFVLSAYVLVFGHLGISAQGVTGVPYAFAIQAYLNIIILLFCFYYQKQFKPMGIFKWRSHQRWRYLKQLFQIGWPMCMQFGGELMAFFVISIMIGWLGKNELAAAQVTQQCLFLFVVPMFAVAEATGIMVSHAVGGKQYQSVKRIGEISLIIAMILVSVAALIFLAFPEFLASLYIDVKAPQYTHMIHLIKILFILVAFSITFDTLRNVASGALRGFYDTRFAMWAGLGAMWIISVPGGYLLGVVFHYGVIGFRIASAFAFLIGALLVLWRWRERVKEYSQLP